MLCPTTRLVLTESMLLPATFGSYDRVLDIFAEYQASFLCAYVNDGTETRVRWYQQPVLTYTYDGTSG